MLSMFGSRWPLAADIIYPMRWTLLAIFAAASFASDPGGWPQWRGPHWNGIADSDAPLHWSDTQNIKWKAEIPGRGHSSPVIWGNRIFVTTAVPTGAPAPAADSAQQPQGRRGFGRSSGPQPEQKFLVLCFDRNTGKKL